MVNTIMDQTGAPASWWLLCLMYVCYLLNYTYSSSIDAVPMQCLTGSTPDISPLTCFPFRHKVYYKVDDSNFPSDSWEKLAWFVGIGESVGHAMTFKLLTVDTNKIIYRSNVCSAEDPDYPNLHIDPLSNKSLPQFVKSKTDPLDTVADDDPEGHDNGKESSHMPIFDPSDLVGRTFLMKPQEDGQCF